MTDNLPKKMICGDYGGMTLSGEPCNRIVPHPGKCHLHEDGAVNGGGRPSHEPTAKDRAFVECCIMGGIVQEEIAAVLGVSVPTLLKHYRKELDEAYTKANAKVVQTAFQQATSGKCPAMTIFWLKARMGWSEKHQVDVTSAGEKVSAPVIYLPVQDGE